MNLSQLPAGDHALFSDKDSLFSNQDIDNDATTANKESQILSSAKSAANTDNASRQSKTDAQPSWHFPADSMKLDHSAVSGSTNFTSGQSAAGTQDRGTSGKPGVQNSEGYSQFGSTTGVFPDSTYPGAGIRASMAMTREEVQESFEATRQAETSITVDDFDPDDGYESDSDAVDSVSLASSVRDFLYENGRRYHRFREGAYNFPNDDSEQNREDLKSEMTFQLLGCLHFAPIGPYPQNILDACTGTGGWAMQIGDQYPSANVLGVDLSPIQPQWVPPNVRFMVDDVESPWLHPLNHFDYIHLRHTVMAIRDWPRLLSNAFNHTKPGGWVELQEIYHFPQCEDGTMPPDWPISKFWDMISAGLGAMGINFHGTLTLADKMRAAGFVDVTERIFMVPIGPWAKNSRLRAVGHYWCAVLEDGVQPIALGPLTRGLGWSREEVEVFLVDVRQAYRQVARRNSAVHAYMPMYVIYGQKPLNA